MRCKPNPCNSPNCKSGKSVMVNSGVPLTIYPGVQVIFDPGMSLSVDGVLSAVCNSFQTLNFKSTLGTDYTLTLEIGEPVNVNRVYFPVVRK